MLPGAGKKVLVAMSGGVDSSVAAAILKDQGFEVVGCFMRLGSEDSVETEACSLPAVTPHALPSNKSFALPISPGLGSQLETRNSKLETGSRGCCSLNDAADARMVAALLDVPFYVLNFKRDFGRIIDYFVSEYNAGRTPNPCVRCNDWLKFGKLAAYAESIGAHYVATGHYARVEHDEPAANPGAGANPRARGARLLRGVDPGKDQSYVLFGTPIPQLNHMLLPIGAMHKSEVRAIAQKKGLPVFDKPDSQEICFVPDDNYAGLIARRTPEELHPGQLVDGQGNVIGPHDGQQHFTIGQRRGLGIAQGRPLYVTGKDAATNTVTVGSAEDLLSDGLTANQTNWLVAPPLNGPIACQVKIRYRSVPVPATVRATAPDQMEVRFEQPQSAVTPGQAVVCYDGERVLGGGWIE